MWNHQTKKVSKTRDVVFLNRMYLQAPENTKKWPKNQEPDDTESESIRQDERGGTITTEFDANDNDVSVVDSMGSSVSDTPTVKSDPGRSKYGCTYRCTMHYDPTTGRTIGAEATALANYYQCLEEADDNIECTNVGAGIGGDFENAMEFKPMKYKEAVNRPEGEVWAGQIKNDHDQMVKKEVWEPVKKSSIPRGTNTKVVDSIWACKEKGAGNLHGRLNACGFKQVEGVHYDRSSTHAPVTYAGTIPIVLILLLMADWQGWIMDVDVKGTFLHGKFKDGKVIYMKVPLGFDKFHPEDVVLKLKKCTYRLKQRWHSGDSCSSVWRV
jgi:hypothetical protein